MRTLLRIGVVFSLIATISGCAEEKLGQSYMLSGYITPVVGMPDSVLKGKWLHIRTLVGRNNQQSSLTAEKGESIWVQTDSLTGYFEVVYSDPPYTETQKETRDIVKGVGIQLVRGYGWSAGADYVTLSNNCHWVNARFYPPGGNDNIMQYCVPVR
jgi:hypothetical protein